MPEVTLFYAGAIAVLYAILSTRVAMMRGSTAIVLGDGGNAKLFFAQRQFGNLTEYGAMAILVLLLLELSDVSTIWLHTYGAALLTFRVMHPFVLFDTSTPALWQQIGRFVAAAGTALLLLVGGVVLILTHIP